jgi:hypothetical protein
MNANIYEYGTDPKTGLNRRLVRDTVTIQEEIDGRDKPKAVVFLRLQTYVDNEGVITVVTDNTASFEVVKGEVSKDVNGNVLPKYIVDPVTGARTLDIDPETELPKGLTGVEASKYLNNITEAKNILESILSKDKK